MIRILVYFDCGHAAITEDGVLTTALQVPGGLTGLQLVELIKTPQIRADTYHANPQQFCKLCFPNNNPYELAGQVIQAALERAGLPKLSPEELHTEIMSELKRQGFTQTQQATFLATRDKTQPS